MKLSNYYTQAKHLHSWRTLRISRPLFVGTLLRHSFKGTLEGNLVPRAFVISVKRIAASGNESYYRSHEGLSANQKEEHFASSDNGRGRRVDGLKSTSPFVDSLVQNVSKEVEQQNEAGKRAQGRLIL